MNELLSGALAMGYAVAGLFFLKFWRQSRDRLFAGFSLAFWILAFQRAALTVVTPAVGVAEKNIEGHMFFYMLRLFAFFLILLAIIDKNRVRHS
jgi:hypothetical protein